MDAIHNFQCGVARSVASSDVAVLLMQKCEAWYSASQARKAAATVSQYCCVAGSVHRLCSGWAVVGRGAGLRCVVLFAADCTDGCAAKKRAARLPVYDRAENNQRCCVP